MSLKLVVTYAECHIYAACAECRYSECHYAECHYGECRGSVIMVSVVAPKKNVSTLIENNGSLCLNQVLDLSGSG